MSLTKIFKILKEDIKWLGEELILIGKDMKSDIIKVIESLENTK